MWKSNLSPWKFLSPTILKFYNFVPSVCQFSGTIVDAQRTFLSGNWCLVPGYLLDFSFHGRFLPLHFLFPYFWISSSLDVELPGLVVYIFLLLLLLYFFSLSFCPTSWKSFSTWSSNFSVEFLPHCSHIFNGQELCFCCFSSLNVLHYNILCLHKGPLHFLQKVIPRYFTIFGCYFEWEIFSTIF